MVESHVPTAAKRNTPTTSQVTIPLVASLSDAAELEHQIRERAYQLYEGRGCEPGQDQQDWVKAEHEILNQRP